MRRPTVSAVFSVLTAQPQSIVDLLDHLPANTDALAIGEALDVLVVQGKALRVRDSFTRLQSSTPKASRQNVPSPTIGG
jgi:hypothetical protein